MGSAFTAPQGSTQVQPGVWLTPQGGYMYDQSNPAIANNSAMMATGGGGLSGGASTGTITGNDTVGGTQANYNPAQASATPQAQAYDQAYQQGVSSGNIQNSAYFQPGQGGAGWDPSLYASQMTLGNPNSFNWNSNVGGATDQANAAQANAQGLPSNTYGSVGNASMVNGTLTNGASGNTPGYTTQNGLINPLAQTSTGGAGAGGATGGTTVSGARGGTAFNPSGPVGGFLGLGARNGGGTSGGSTGGGAIPPTTGGIGAPGTGPITPPMQTGGGGGSRQPTGSSFGGNGPQPFSGFQSNAMPAAMGGGNQWGNASEGNPYSYMTGQSTNGLQQPTSNALSSIYGGGQLYGGSGGMGASTGQMYGGSQFGSPMSSSTSSYGQNPYGGYGQNSMSANGTSMLQQMPQSPYGGSTGIFGGTSQLANNPYGGYGQNPNMTPNMGNMYAGMMSPATGGTAYMPGYPGGFGGMAMQGPLGGGPYTGSQQTGGTGGVSSTGTSGSSTPTSTGGYTQNGTAFNPSGPTGGFFGLGARNAGTASGMNAAMNPQMQSNAMISPSGTGNMGGANPMAATQSMGSMGGMMNFRNNMMGMGGMPPWLQQQQAAAAASAAATPAAAATATPAATATTGS